MKGRLRGGDDLADEFVAKSISKEAVSNSSTLGVGSNSEH